MNCFGKFNPSVIKYTLQYIGRKIVKCAMCKYKRFCRHRRRAEKRLSTIKTREPKLVCSMEQNVFVLLNDKSRMERDFHVRFGEKFEMQFLLLTQLMV